MRPSDVDLVTRIFRPSAPIDDPQMFVGRDVQRDQFVRALIAPGRHVVLFGERGVGKTSLVNVVTATIRPTRPMRVVRYTCSSSDKYHDIVRKFLEKTGQSHRSTTKVTTETASEGKVKVSILEAGAKASLKEEHGAEPVLPDTVTPDTFVSRYCLQPAIFVLDEVDRLNDEETRRLIAETVKIQADRISPVKFVFCGVSTSAKALVGIHPSTIRNILALEVPVMSVEEIQEIAIVGFRRLKIGVHDDLLSLIVRASHGLPYFAHLLCEELALYALSRAVLHLLPEHFFSVLPSALENVGYAAASAFDQIAYGDDAHLHNPDLPRRPIVPGSVRQAIVMGLALARADTAEGAAIVSNQLLASSAEFVPADFADLTEVHVELALSEAKRVTDLIVFSGNTPRFRDAFARGYTWLRAAARFGPEAILNILAQDRPESDGPSKPA